MAGLPVSFDNIHGLLGKRTNAQLLFPKWTLPGEMKIQQEKSVASFFYSRCGAYGKQGVVIACGLWGRQV